MRCALVTGVQTCALLISFARAARWRSAADDGRRGCRRAAGDAAAAVQAGNSGMNVRHNESMARHTSWRVGGPADCYFEPDTRESLSAFVRELSANEPILWVGLGRSEEHTSELQSLMRISYAVFCLK